MATAFKVANSQMVADKQNGGSSEPVISRLSQPLLQGYLQATVEHFELQYCSQGLLSGQIAIPLFDHDFKPIGYAGLYPNDVYTMHPSYMYLFTQRYQGYVAHCRRHNFLYNANNQHWPVDNIVIVEHYADVWYLWQIGISTVVAIGGPTLTDHQVSIVKELVHPKGTVWVMPRGNTDCAQHIYSIVLALNNDRKIRWIRCPHGYKPMDVSAERLNTVLPCW